MARFLLALLISLAVGDQTTTIPVTFAWALDSTHEGDVAWQVEIDGAAPVSCGSPVVTPTDRRCTAQIAPGTHTFRLRGTKATTDTILIGEWSAPITEEVTAPGVFTVRDYFPAIGKPTMSFSQKVGSFNIGSGAAGSTVVISGLSFQPKVVIFKWSGATALNTGARTTHRRGQGWATSASRFGSIASYDADGVGTADTNRGIATDACIMEVDATTRVGWADLQSFNSDGFTLEILDAFPTDLYVTYWALGGSELINAEAGSFLKQNATGNQTVNNADNFQPDITFFLSAWNTATTFPSFAGDSHFVFGAAKDSTDQYVISTASNDAATTTQAASHSRKGEILVGNAGNPQSAPNNRISFVSHNASPGGFTVNVLEHASTDLGVLYLSIKGGAWALGDFLTATTATTIAKSGFGFTPSGVLVVSHNKAATAQDATPDAHDELSIGMATSPSERAVHFSASRNGDATASFVYLAARNDAVYINADVAQATFTTEGLMDVQSFDSDGVTFVMDDPDPAQAFVWFVAAGSAVSTAAELTGTALDGITEADIVAGGKTIVITLTGGAEFIP